MRQDTTAYKRVAYGRPSFTVTTHKLTNGFYQVYRPRIGGMTFVDKFNTPADAVAKAKEYKAYCRGWLKITKGSPHAR